MSKILHITNAYMKLPDNFDGKLSDALFLMYQARNRGEQLKEIEDVINIDLEKLVGLKNKTCAIEYEFIDY